MELACMSLGMCSTAVRLSKLARLDNHFCGGSEYTFLITERDMMGDSSGIQFPCLHDRKKCHTTNLNQL